MGLAFVPDGRSGVRMKRKQPERQLQKAVAEYLGRALPAGAFFSSIPGGEGRATRTPGYAAGLPDMLIIWDGRPFFLELKSKRGRVSPAQHETMLALIRNYAPTTTVRSLEDIEDFARINGIPLRAKVAA